MWGDPAVKEAKKQRKISRIGKSAAYSIGGGLGIWALKLFYPHPEGSERITAVFGLIGWILILYGVIMLTIIMLRPNLTRKANMLFIWFVIPACLYYIFVNNWHG
jgi:hypothetical protein